MRANESNEEHYLRFGEFWLCNRFRTIRRRIKAPLHGKWLWALDARSHATNTTQKASSKAAVSSALGTYVCSLQPGQRFETLTTVPKKFQKRPSD